MIFPWGPAIMPDIAICILIQYQSLDKFKNKSMNQVLYIQILVLNATEKEDHGAL